MGNHKILFLSLLFILLNEGISSACQLDKWSNVDLIFTPLNSSSLNIDENTVSNCNTCRYLSYAKGHLIANTPSTDYSELVFLDPASFQFATDSANALLYFYQGLLNLEYMRLNTAVKLFTLSSLESQRNNMADLDKTCHQLLAFCLSLSQENNEASRFLSKPSLPIDSANQFAKFLYNYNKGIYYNNEGSVEQASIYARNANQIATSEQWVKWPIISNLLISQVLSNNLENEEAKKWINKSPLGLNKTIETLLAISKAKVWAVSDNSKAKETIKTLIDVGNFNQKVIGYQNLLEIMEGENIKSVLAIEKKLQLLQKEGNFKSLSNLIQNTKSDYLKELTSSKTKNAILESELMKERSFFSKNFKIIFSACVILLVIVIALLFSRLRFRKSYTEKLKTKNNQLNSNFARLKKLNYELEIAKQEAEAGLVAKTNFLAVTSHEIRTPMNGIMGMASLLLDTPLSDEQKKYVSTIETSSESLLIILNDILDFSKMEAGKMNIEHKLIDLPNLIEEIFTMFSKQAKEKKVELIKSINNVSLNVFKGDILRIRQVLINLISNALKFTENGKVEIEVSMLELFAGNEEEQNAKIKFSINDTGIGITEEKQKTIFEAFEQEDTSTSRKYGGIGLGLSISKKLVELMDGEIGLHSIKNQGTQFYFILNVKIPVSNNTRDRVINLKEEKKEFSGSPIPSAENLRILVAEDNLFNKMLIEKLLEKFGYSTYDHAFNGLEVLSKMEENKYDIVLMDIQMPEKDGMETTKDILSLYGTNRPKIVALTADANEASKQTYLNAGMDNFLSKPYKPEDLKEILDKYSLELSKI